MLVGSVLRGVGLVMVLSTQEIPSEAWPQLIGFIVGMIFGLIIAILMTSGGVSMAMRKSLGTARTAAVIAAIPCFGLCVCPFGIWACVLLFNEQAKRDFGVR